MLALWVGLSLGAQEPWREGDIVFQTSRSSQSQAIQLATRSKWSHMGLVFRDRGRWMVLEAVQPVRATPIEAWIQRGTGGRAVAKRLRDADSRLTPAAMARMKKAGRRFLGKPYDLTFEWDDRRIYCSELVWKVYKEGLGIEVGQLARLRDFDLSNPVVRKKMHERYGNRVPGEMPVISPAAIYDCPELVEAWKR
ncbi:MAG: YiiX family permuted papain-like enzyme [Holophagaceae bacterium]|nr:YiiX family permuted papain-like enzyme [Holophagaceae bacterium]